MNRKLYGIKQVKWADDVIIDHPIDEYVNGEKVRDLTEWNTVRLARPGSLQVDSKEINGVMTYTSTLSFNAIDDIPDDGKTKFFLAETTCGCRLLVGLGHKYMTTPMTEMTYIINDNAANGCVITFKVLWNSLAGIIYAE